MCYCRDMPVVRLAGLHCDVEGSFPLFCAYMLLSLLSLPCFPTTKKKKKYIWIWLPHCAELKLHVLHASNLFINTQLCWQFWFVSCRGTGHKVFWIWKCMNNKVSWKITLIILNIINNLKVNIILIKKNDCDILLY